MNCFLASHHQPELIAWARVMLVGCVLCLWQMFCCHAACVSWTVSTRGKDLVRVQMVVACTQLPESCSLGKDVCLMCQLHTGGWGKMSV